MDSYQTSISGIQSAALGVSWTAQDVANLNTDGYKAKRLDLADRKEGGVQPTKLTESQEPTPPGTSNVDLATAMTNLMTQSGAYNANLQMVKTQDEMIGQLLDMRK